MQLAFILAYLPIVDTVIAAWGAMQYPWGWSWTNAILLFTVPLIFLLLLLIVSNVLQKCRLPNLYELGLIHY